MDQKYRTCMALLSCQTHWQSHWRPVIDCDGRAQEASFLCAVFTPFFIRLPTDYRPFFTVFYRFYRFLKNGRKMNRAALHPHPSRLPEEEGRRERAVGEVPIKCPCLSPRRARVVVALGENQNPKLPGECRMGTVDLQKGQSAESHMDELKVTGVIVGVNERGGQSLSAFYRSSANCFIHLLRINASLRWTVRGEMFRRSAISVVL
jgi:hypothetical protein